MNPRLCPSRCPACHICLLDLLDQSRIVQERDDKLYDEADFNQDFLVTAQPSSYYGFTNWLTRTPFVTVKNRMYKPLASSPRSLIVATASLVILVMGKCPMLHSQEPVIYCLDASFRTNSLLRIPTGNPAAASYINKSYLPYAMDFNSDGTVLYAIDGHTLRLGTIDLDTGLFKPLHALTGDVHDEPLPISSIFRVISMSVDPTDDQIYFTTLDDRLFTVDKETGNTMLIGIITVEKNPKSALTGLILDMAINSLGQLYVHVSSDELWNVDRETLEASLVGDLPFGLTGFGNQGMDFDPLTDELYAAVFSSTQVRTLFGRWDVVTGEFTLIETMDGIQLELAITNGTAHGFNLANPQNSLVTFQLDQPLPFDSVVNVGNYRSNAIDFGPDGRLYAFDSISNCFGTIDLNSGCLDIIEFSDGDLDGVLCGLTYCQQSNTFLGIRSDIDDGESNIYEINPFNGNSTFIQDIPLATVADIAADLNGNVYIMGTNNFLYLWDQVVGAISIIGFPSFVGDANFAGMDFDPATNQLFTFFAMSDGTYSLGTWNFETGNLAKYNEISNLESLFVPLGTTYALKLAVGRPDLLGDINRDGVVDLLDIEPFVALVTSSGYSYNGDFDYDGQVSLLDVAPFVDVLTGL